MATTLGSLNDLFKEVYVSKLRWFLCEHWSVEAWLQEDLADIALYADKHDNAAKAWDIKTSKLYKAMK